MKVYRKPSCISQQNIQGIVPLAAAAAAIGLSTEALAAVSIGAAALAGAAAGLTSNKGGRISSLNNNRSLQEQIVY